ncbi:methyl-accepting chemotaxis sensory transducer with Cache sensor [Pseudomonas japonica]|uniref:Methyl-accepting chemotaxis sensory transducer with Cache sensor n=2 Tax=Pseudomonas japonica TaxID=256466 RepID=A0A239BFA4_9PSED|nr:methyl-accepting chemotaxis protein [Pseudomonas japonica]SNS05733.1 methyl-accepting chemotaxis sensory transducer with Cache sensor [Pseudomonas japonica]
MNIKTKLTCAFGALAVIPVALIACLVVYNLNEQARDGFVDTSSREIRQIDNTVNVFLDAIAQNVAQWADDPQIVETRELKVYTGETAPSLPLSEGSRQLLERFTRYAKAHPTTSFVSMARTDGNYVAWPDEPDLKNYDPRKRPWYQLAVANPGKVMRTSAYLWGNEALICTVRTIHGPGGEVLGVMGTDVSLGQLAGFIGKTKLGESGYLMLVEDTGAVLVDPSNPANAFKQLKDLGSDYAQLAGTSKGLVEVELGGKRYMANVWTSPTLGWRFIGLIEKSEVMAGVTSLTWTILAIALVLSALFAVLGAAFANVIIKPINGVSGSLEDIAQGEGDLTRSLPIQGNDETATLAGWFNQFLERIRSLVQRIGNASADLQSASETNSRVASNMGDATGRQRQAVELVSTAFNEMVATANEVAKSCTHAATSADTGQRQVSAGQQQIEQATSSVARLSENLLQATEAMQELERESQDINAILGTIRSIAEQTNLLALNAAIEAARAGEQGRGFAVVADEVRALAKRTADSTGEIDGLLGGLARRAQDVTQQMRSSLDMSQQSVDCIREARDSFEGIRASVDVIRDQSNQIATAAEEQHQVAEDINQHIIQIQADAQLIEELAGSAQADSRQLSELSQEFRSLVSRFRT